MVDIFEYDVFLSFASSDEEIVKPIWQELCLSGLRVFWSDASLKNEVGNSWFEVIQSSLEKSRHLLLICTPDSMSSKWVRREYSAFFNHCYIPNVRRLVPVLLKGYKASDLPLFFKDIEACQLEGASSLKQIISIVGGVNIDELRSENEFLKQNLESLTHEKSSLEAEIKKLNERLTRKEEKQKSNLQTESKKSPEADRKTSAAQRVQKYIDDHPEMVKKREAFDFMGLSSAATSKEIAQRYWNLKEEYETLFNDAPKALQELCLSRLDMLQNSYELIFPLKRKEESERIDRAFETLQLPKEAHINEIRKRIAELKRTCQKAMQSSDPFIKEAAAQELNKLEEASSVIVSIATPAQPEPASQSSLIEVSIPQMGEAIAEALITKWLKHEGAWVKKDEPLFEISTDKVDAEIPSPATGVLSQILTSAGETVPVKTVVALLNPAV